MIPNAILEVLTPALSLALVDLATLKSDLGIVDASQDARLDRVIVATGQRIAGYVGRPLVEQRYRETWRLPARGIDYWSVALPRDPVGTLPLSRTPMTVISSVTEAGTLLDPSLYVWMDTVGLQRLDATGAASFWATGTVQVIYKAGWIGAKVTVTPPQVALPDDLYEAALDTARAEFLGKDRDPGAAIRSEEVPDVYRVDYDTRLGMYDQGGPAAFGLPTRLAGVFDSYRRAPFAF